VGTGLGLAIARSYARAHGGDLVYEDAEPHGARFRLVLPMS
jgi:two-component system OmpR family sensor kinase